MPDNGTYLIILISQVTPYIVYPAVSIIILVVLQRKIDRRIRSIFILDKKIPD
jgi:hypothetical protein